MTHHRTRRLTVAGTALLTAALLAGCGGNGHDTGDAGHDTGTPTAAVPSDAAFNAADVTFATDMIAHHQQALDMAEIATTRASSPEVKDLAARIAAAQDPEIDLMSGWLRDWDQPVPSTAPGAGHGEHAGMPGMMTDQEMTDLMTASGPDFDRMFLQMMIRHHGGAVEMARTASQQGQHPDVRELAEKVATDQTAEIDEMRELLATR